MAEPIYSTGADELAIAPPDPALLRLLELVDWRESSVSNCDALATVRGLLAGMRAAILRGEHIEMPGIGTVVPVQSGHILFRADRNLMGEIYGR